QLPVLREALQPYHEALQQRLWSVLEDPTSDADQQFRAACALAEYDVTEEDANRQRWERIAPFVADRLLALVQQDPSSYTPLLQTLTPVRGRLLSPLSAVFRSGTRPEADRSWAASFVAEYAAERPEVLADLLLDAEAKQFAVLWPKIEAQCERAAAVCQ